MPFGSYLKMLREMRGKRPEDLAGAAKLHVSTVYKAEKGDQVRWETVKQLYAGLCKEGDQRSELMVRWVMALDPEFTTLASARRVTEVLVADDAGEQMARAQEISRILATLHNEERDTLERWCRLYATSKPTRGMARAWLDAMEPAESQA